MQIAQTVTFDGHVLNDMFYVGVVTVGLPEFIPDYETSALGNGAVFKRASLGTIEIEVPLVVRPNVIGGPRKAISDLMSRLDVDSPRVLSMSKDGGLWRLVVPIGAPTIQDYEWNDRLSVKLLQLEPALYGTLRSVTVPSSGSVSFNVGGNYKTSMALSTSAAVRDSTSEQWGIRLDNADYLHFSVPTSSASSIEADCKKRTCSINGDTSLPTLTSDWLELEPGEHAISNDVGTGACTVSWYERWH